MRFGNWRGGTLAIALLGLGLCLAATPAVRAGGYLWHTIPRETLAQDYRTGGVYYAPPIPYGHYAKDYVGCIHGALAGAHGMIGKLCGSCFGKGCGACGGLGCNHGDACGDCGGKGCGKCGGLGLFSKHLDGLGHGNGGGLIGGHGHGLSHKDVACGLPGCGVAATSQGVPMAPIMPTAQAAPMSCGKCGGKGLCDGLFGRKPSLCDSCGGFGFHKGGHGLGHGGGDPCDSCGGKGCGKCGGLGHLGNLHGALKGHAHGLLNRFGIGGVEYFVGPGGPVPLTPGYVPYVVPVRSPRDFFAFPPFYDREF